MTPADQATFAELLLRLDTVYEKRASTIRVQEYWLALNDVPIGLLREAVSVHMQESDRYPRISTLRALVDRVAERHAPRALPPPTIEIDGNRAYRCLHCRDTGWQLADGNEIESWTDPTTGKAITVRPCRCPAGDVHRPDHTRPKRYARSQPQLHRAWKPETEG